MADNPGCSLLEAFARTYESALANFHAASILAANFLHAQAASLAVLAMEEVGKMVLLDGLLFARPERDFSSLLQPGQVVPARLKLDLLEDFTSFLSEINETGPNPEDARHQQTMAFVLNDLRAKRQWLAELLGPDFRLQDLVGLRDKGLFCHCDQGRVRANSEAVDALTTKAILELSWRMLDSLKFVLGDSLAGYRQRAIGLEARDEAGFVEDICRPGLG